MLNCYRRLVSVMVGIAWLGLAASGCGLETGHPPVARISVSPDMIIENDGFQTLVTLDATASSDPVDDPNGQRPLRFEWHIGNDEFRFETGDATSAMATARFRGDRPATIRLTVTDEDGLSTTSSVQLRLVVNNNVSE